MTTGDRYVCELPVAEVPAREAQVRRLREGLLGWWRDAREVHLRFEGELAPTAHAFVRDESRCCGFFDLEVDAGDDQVALTVVAPPGAEPSLDALVAAFTQADPSA